MATLGINDFKSKLVGGGARNNLFQVTCNFPAFAGGNSELASFLIKAAQLPSSIISPIVVPFRGRHLTIAGDRSFDPWNITIINDSNMSIRNAFERWVGNINNNAYNTGLVTPASYMVDMSVSQLDKTGRTTKTYIIRSAWPSVVSAIDLSYDTENAIEEFTVQLEMLYWESPESAV